MLRRAILHHDFSPEAKDHFRRKHRYAFVNVTFAACEEDPPDA
jgi:hypothetical protein